MSTGKVYQIGGISMSHQSFLMILAGSSISALVFIAGLLSGKRGLIVASLISALVFLAVTLYQAYIVNCMIVGKCVKLSWFLTILFLITCFGYMLGSVSAIRRGSQVSMFATPPSMVTASSPKSKSRRSKK